MRGQIVMEDQTLKDLVHWALTAAGLVTFLQQVGFDLVKGTVKQYRDLRDWMADDRFARQDARRRLRRARGRD